MHLRRETGLGIGAILVLQVLLSLLVIVLLVRMGPAVERILEENVYSEEAVEQMLATLAAPTAGDGVPESFAAALERAQANVTEEPELPLLETIAARHRAAFAGDEAARDAVIEALRRLGEVNRASMSRADDRAQRLGQAGAWGGALLGALALGLAIMAYRRLRLRLELPVEELRRTTAAIRNGNHQARCPTAEGPYEIKTIARNLNWILDEWVRPNESGPEDASRNAAIRRLLLSFLDRESTPIVVVDDEGTKVLENAASLDVDEAIPTPERPGQWSLETIEGTDLYLARLAPPTTDGGGR